MNTYDDDIILEPIIRSWDEIGGMIYLNNFYIIYNIVIFFIHLFQSFMYIHVTL